MKLLEYEAKNILRRAGITTPAGVVVASGEAAPTLPFPLPAVVKSQVPTGGRGKLGGVMLVKDEPALTDAIKTISTLKIKGFLPRHLLVEQAIDIGRELYLSLVINRATASIDLIVHPEGGVEVESQDGFFSRSLTGDNAGTVGEALAELFGLEEQSFALADLVEKLFTAFTREDMTLLEINPLVLTKQGELIAGDAKITLDDDAAFRHPDWDFEEKPANANFVSLDENGTIATIANGAGLAMATVDAVTDAGLTPANFLDIGGTATVESITESFHKITEFPEVRAIIINIFGGIVRCDTVATAIVEARRSVPDLPRLIIRLSGTNSEQAAEILARDALSLLPNLTQCIEEAHRA